MGFIISLNSILCIGLPVVKSWSTFSGVSYVILGVRYFVIKYVLIDCFVKYDINEV